MNKNLMVVAVAVAAVLILNKAATAATSGAKSAPVKNTNVNDQLWSSLLGGSWKALTDAKNADGSQAFLMKNALGQAVTSDGKPVGEEWQRMFPATYLQGAGLPVEIGTAGDSTDYLAQLGYGNDSGLGTGWIGFGGH